jgi:hypothetical protein
VTPGKPAAAPPEGDKKMDLSLLTTIAAAVYGGWAEYRARAHKRALAAAKAETARTQAELAAILEAAHKLPR